MAAYTPEKWPDPAVDWLEPHYHAAVIVTDVNWTRHLVANTVHADMAEALNAAASLLEKFSDDELLTDLFGKECFATEIDVTTTYCIGTPCGLNSDIGGENYLRHRYALGTCGVTE